MITEAEKSFKSIMPLQPPTQEFIQRGFFQEAVAEESKVLMPGSSIEAGMEVDETSSSSEEISKEQEESILGGKSLRNS